MAQFLGILYFLVVAALSVYGLLGFFTFIEYMRLRTKFATQPKLVWEHLPRVTIQLPIFNERFVVERLIAASTQIDYPSTCMQIQVIDDSNDETSEIAASVISYYKRQGVNIQHIRRSHRQGFKAGALANALSYADGEYLAIFDADFLPPKNFLLKIMPQFLASPNLGMVQARWGHLNAQESALTSAQSIALDKHFVMEQSVRHWASMFPKFNGAAGVWRRECIEDAGGWQADTVCEDLCLSTRAVLNGWHFQYMPDVVAPAELPTSIIAFKNQQARWAKGSIQCLQKYLKAILNDRKSSWMGRLYAILTMSAYSTHILLLILILLQIPLLVYDVRFPPLLVIFSLIGLGQPLLFIWAQKESYSDWPKRLLYFPALLFVAIGIAPSNSKAIIHAVVRKDHPFIRTPKGFIPKNQSGKGEILPAYRLPIDSIVFIEIFLFAYSIFGLGLTIVLDDYRSVVLLLAGVIGFGYVLLLELHDFLPFHSELVEKNPPTARDCWIDN